MMSSIYFGAVYRFPAGTPYGTLFEFAHSKIREKNPEIPADQFNYLNAPNPGDVRILNPETGLLANDQASYVTDDEPYVAAAVTSIKEARRLGFSIESQLKEELTDFLETRAIDVQA